METAGIENNIPYSSLSYNRNFFFYNAGGKNKFFFACSSCKIGIDCINECNYEVISEHNIYEHKYFNQQIFHYADDFKKILCSGCSNETYSNEIFKNKIKTKLNTEELIYKPLEMTEHYITSSFPHNYKGLNYLMKTPQNLNKKIALGLYRIKGSESSSVYIPNIKIPPCVIYETKSNMIQIAGRTTSRRNIFRTASGFFSKN